MEVALKALLWALYGLLAFVPLLNALLMSRPKGHGQADLEFLIPARNESKNLSELLPLLNGERVTVCDDESTDDTTDVARAHGAQVIQPREPLPSDWMGKNRACDMLAKSSIAEWIVFLDADVRPSPGFGQTLRSMIERWGTTHPVMTGFPKFIAGDGLEPVYLSWVPWSLLALIPFGLIEHSGKGHARFTNGQFTMWRRSLYMEVLPHDQVRGEVLEDIQIGRLMAKLGTPVKTVLASGWLDVRMYGSFRDALEGMSKNSVDIVGSTMGSLLFAILLLTIAWGWVWLGFPALLLLVFSKCITDRLVGYPLWLAVFAPITLSLAGYTVLRSVWRRKTGRIEWKGRPLTRCGPK